MNFVIVFLILFLTACQKKQAEKPAKECLKINFQEGDLLSLHPHDLIAYLRGISIGKILFEGLTRIDSEKRAQLSGARSVEISPDGLFYTFKLRENRWSDGTPVTAFQYEAAWKEALSPVSFCKSSDLLFVIKKAREAKMGKFLWPLLG